MSKTTNALKHGVFSKTIVLLGEDEQEFNLLHEALRKEWNVSGPTEEDAVLTIAKCIWSKRRIGLDRTAKMDAAKQRSHAKIKLQNRMIDMNIEYVDKIDAILAQATPDETALTEENLAEQLSPMWEKWIKAELPRKNSRTYEAWLKAINERIGRWIVTEIFKLEKLEQAEEPFLEELFMKQEGTLEDRINGTMDRAIKRLCQVKGMKEIIARTAVEAIAQKVLEGEKPLKEVEAPPLQADEQPQVVEEDDGATQDSGPYETK